MRAHVVCLGLLVFAVLGCGSDKPEAKGGSTLKKLETKDIKVGTGPAAKTGDWVWVRYTGKLADGTEFDSNATGKPLYAFQLGAGSVIQGWDKGVIGMKEGGKRKLSIPPDLAYGPEGSGGKVPPNADLFFDVELFKVLPKDKLKEVSVKILKEGTGRPSKNGDMLVVDYEGKTIDGEEVDSSKTQGKPAVFTLGKQELLASGLEAGIIGMKVGEQRVITLPPGMGLPIDEGSIQIFNVTLKAIK